MLSSQRREGLLHPWECLCLAWRCSTEQGRAASRAPRAAKALCGRELTQHSAAKWAGDFFRDQLDTAWGFLIRVVRETNDIYCTEKTRGGDFLASHNDVARLPSVFCSAVIFFTILWKSCDLVQYYYIFYFCPQIFLGVQFSKHRVVLQLCFVNPKQSRGISSHPADSFCLYSLHFHVWFIHSSLWLNPPLIIFEELAH